ncbi:transcriptional regulator [Microbacterium sp. RU33B]|uniref:ArsR/SmtB family transcription factor n=1 Tax=Microbacterium sp. RU33B TaxID=1907390 RepID=UPI00095F1FA1|nr:helix-turn-helix domain-containing protein [Microbacterium sp. RU33B]SIT73707.1 transcriptional regulator, ArsR family [Microbacterium sp. RU33B]
MSENGDQTATGKPVRVLDSGALKALAHPLRVQIYDLLSQFGPQTASSLAERLGESSGATSYHLRALAKHQLIREVEGRGTARERWWERPRGAVSMTNPETVKTPAGRAVTEVVISEFYRRRDDQLQDYLRKALRGNPDDWEAMLTTSTIALTKEQFETLSESIQTLIDEASERYRDQTGPDVRRFTVRTDIFPLEALPEGASS